MAARVYIVTNKINGKQYVGQTITENSKRGHGNALKDSYKKYGIKNFEYVTIVNNISQDAAILDYLEKFWIKTLNTMAPYGYNLEAGGKRGKVVYHAPQLGMPHSLETRKKMSESQKKLWRSLDIHPNVGKKHTEETKAKMSAIKKLQVQSLETRLKRSESIKAWHAKREEQLCH
jgi:group I intron endonuclease